MYLLKIYSSAEWANLLGLCVPPSTVYTLNLKDELGTNLFDGFGVHGVGGTLWVMGCSFLGH